MAVPPISPPDHSTPLSIELKECITSMVLLPKLIRPVDPLFVHKFPDGCISIVYQSGKKFRIQFNISEGAE